VGQRVAIRLGGCEPSQRAIDCRPPSNDAPYDGQQRADDEQQA